MSISCNFKYANMYTNIFNLNDEEIKMKMTMSSFHACLLIYLKFMRT